MSFPSLKFESCHDANFVVECRQIAGSVSSDVKVGSKTKLVFIWIRIHTGYFKRYWNYHLQQLVKYFGMTPPNEMLASEVKYWIRFHAVCQHITIDFQKVAFVIFHMKLPESYTFML